MKKDSKPGLPFLSERGMRGEAKNRLGLFLGLGTTIGAAVGIVMENIPPALSLGMIIGLLLGLFKKILSDY